jgi:hypothetical protein
VTTRAKGHIIVRTFSRGATGVVEVRTINVGLTATADGRVFRFRDGGADVTRIEPDGTAVLLISGQVPFDFAGVLKIDLETGEPILEPRDRSEEQLARACAVLTGRIAAAPVAEPGIPSPISGARACVVALSL